MRVLSEDEIAALDPSELLPKETSITTQVVFA
jgi:hypothetical protein